MMTLQNLVRGPFCKKFAFKHAIAGLNLYTETRTSIQKNILKIVKILRTIMSGA